ncbi:MAG: phosphohydrolase, partial [Candidatus Omnitrophica bacterium]|nr:phosphohydrolase [Candidatus Omnitrophota bacterium]
PDRLKGEEIPLYARILAVADAYEAMTSKRPYRNPLSPVEAISELERCSGGQFDPQMVHSLVKLLKKEQITPSS